MIKCCPFKSLERENPFRRTQGSDPVALYYMGLTAEGPLTKSLGNLFYFVPIVIDWASLFAYQVLSFHVRSALL